MRRIRPLYLTGLICLWAIFVVLVSCPSHSVREPKVPTGPHFSVLTYNINWGGPGRDLAIDAILRADADIVCLQETTRDWERYLRRGLKTTYRHMLFRHSGGAGGLAFLSKRELKEVEYIQPKSGWFPAWIVMADTPTGQVQILNVHLHPMLSENARFTVSAYFSTKHVRGKEIEEFYPHLQAGLPTMIVGDFNEDESSSAVQWLMEKGMRAALPDFDRDSHTWHWKTSYVTVKGRFDHILHSEHLQCLEARVLQAGASDHYPVLAVFEGAKPGKESRLQNTAEPGAGHP